MEDLVEDARRLKFHASCASFDELRWFAPVTNEVEWEPAEGSYESTGPKGVAHFESGDRIVVGPDHENVPRFYVKNRYNVLSCLPEDIEIPPEVEIDPEARALLTVRSSMVRTVAVKAH